MLLSRSSDYALRALIFLAGHEGEDEHVSLKEISEAMSVPPALLSKLMQALRKEGVVRSFRGSNGGFSLAMAPDDIPLLRVVEIVDGPISVTECQEDDDFCCLIGNCNLLGVFDRIQNQIQGILSDATIADCAGPSLCSTQTACR